MCKLGWICAGISLLVSGLAHADDLLPLKHGFYVSSDTPCENASNATLNLYLGDIMGMAHAQCKVVARNLLANHHYSVQTSCVDLQGSGEEEFTVMLDYEIVSDTEFVVSGEYGSSRSRWCAQDSLPSPWRSNDLTKLAHPKL